VEDACKNNNYFTAFALASAYFEYETNMILGIHFENKIPLEKIARWHLQTKIGLLLGLNMVDRTTHDKINAIIRIRNKLMHPINIWEKGRMLDIFLRYRLTEKEKTSLLSFKECYTKLAEAHATILGEKSKKQ
jgi:hypothetical protein